MGHQFHPILSFEGAGGKSGTTNKPSPFRVHEHPGSMARSDLLFHPEGNHQLAAEDPFQCDMMDETTFQDLDSYWNDPLFALVLKPSLDHGSNNNKNDDDDDDNNNAPRHGKKMDPNAFAVGLNLLHQRICESIMSSPKPDQAPMVGIFATWAQCISKSPLNDLQPPDNQNGDNHDNHDEKNSMSTTAEV
jgi:hypothetical protein